MEKTKLFQMRTDAAFLERLDEWRRHEPDIPPRAEAMRRLVHKGLQFDNLQGMTEKSLEFLLLAINGDIKSEANRQLIQDWAYERKNVKIAALKNLMNQLCHRPDRIHGLGKFTVSESDDGSPDK